MTTSTDGTAATNGDGGVHVPAWMQRVVERIEGMDRLDRSGPQVDAVANAVAGGRRGEILRGEWLGHALHPLLTDLPLGCWLAAGLLDLVGGRPARPAAQRLVGLGLLVVPPTVAAGLAEWTRIERPEERRVARVHAAGNGVVAMLYGASWVARRRGHHARGVTYGLAGGGLAWVTGYLGGHLSFARGVGVGSRGFAGSSPESTPADSTTGAPADRLLDAEETMRVLTIEREQLDVLIADDLLVVRSVHDDRPLFAESDVMAVRMLGG